ncbi:hypothetical protein [Sphaerochaeta globosa]|uniref:Uncharacterized protein n=1 Tax=Sphaerochaeta globosa (strain ATCC BAA-1886 / DSM 22777 / Buddy) TaxID=158189 RepID=F0RV55_SPHGB|nr:hypothetical protein [Sphaerochaeta globosa]ADY12777.1 hypothetical protein SpiBuddy_0950 [Sphaerochaeta globosa str. Buddy]
MNAFTKQVPSMHRTAERKGKIQDCSQFCFATSDSSSSNLLLLVRINLLPLITLITLLFIVVSLIIL